MHFFRVRLVAALLLGITLISVASTYFDILAHKHTLRRDLARRTQWFGASLQSQLEEQFAANSKPAWAHLLSHLRERADQPSLALFNADGALLASAGDVLSLKTNSSDLLQRSLAGHEANRFVQVNKQMANGNSPNDEDAGDSRLWYIDAIPLHNGDRVAGALLMLVDADYIRVEGVNVWQRSFWRIAATVLLVVFVTAGMVRWFLQQPLARAAEWLHRLRHGEAKLEDGADEFGYLIPLAKEVASLAETLSRARLAAETEARLRDAGEHQWTADRLAVHIRQRLGTGKLFVASNREPYMHVRSGRATECIVPPSGLVTALEPILQACDGTWVAHGSGSEDALFVDAHDRLRVPPDEKRYTLRRVWLTPEEEAGYYDGFSNEGLWPLCHIAHTRPIFRASDWNHYQNVNMKFGEILLEEMRGTDHPVVFVQDYHLALLPRIIKNARPDARVALFWHIPWPNPESFGICPWQAELVDGLLGANVVGFHLQSHCNNFLNTVDRVLEARTDWEQFNIRRNGHLSIVRPYPISVAWDETNFNRSAFNQQSGEASGMKPGPQIVVGSTVQKEPDVLTPEIESSQAGPLHRGLGADGKRLLLGVDRMDYTKGIVERLLAIEHLLAEYPRYREQIVFVQIASPSRTQISSYVDLRRQVEETVERINRRFQTSRWKPVILIQRQCNHDELSRFYRSADMCLVTSLHDGMNLVAKEYLAARSDGDGVLVLSRFAGASQELTDALLVNPYDIEQVSASIDLGLRMSPADRRQRIERMRNQVKENNVYRWASNVLSDLCAVRVEDELLEASLNRPRRKLA